MTNGARLLIVDDESSVSITLQAVLEKEGYRVLTANSAPEARRLLRDHPFDVALLDLRLGEVDGLDVLQSVRASQPECVAVVLTGYASLESAIGAVRRGAYDYLMKPCDLDELKLTIAQAAERSALSRALNDRLAELETANATIRRLADELQQRVDEATAELTRKVQELSEAKQQVEEAQRQREGFISIISHELGQPLTVLNAYLQLLQRPNLSDAIQEQARQALIVEIHRLGRLVRELADVSNLAASHFRIYPAPVDLAAIIREQVEVAQLRAEQPVQFESLPALPVLCDPDRVAQVVSNLLGNAAKYSRGSVCVRLWTEAECARISVSDEGPGIPVEQLSTIFEPGIRLTQERTNVPLSGMGLGLYIARGIARAHGGDISVESVLDQGTTFTFSLPLIPQEPAAAPAESSLRAR